MRSEDTFDGTAMGLLVSCCLRLMGYDNLGGAAAAAHASQRKNELAGILAERDNPNVNGRNQPTELWRYCYNFLFVISLTSRAPGRADIPGGTKTATRQTKNTVIEGAYGSALPAES